MSNIFTKMKDYVEKPNRNTFDLSYQNNLTMEFGKLYPVFCKEVVPGDSMRIKPTFGLRFMPLVFPVQTRMQANLHFFYVRNRNLWKDWPDFIGRTKQNLVLPFLSKRVAKKICTTRGLGDYFGLPTTIVGNYGSAKIYSDSEILHPVANWQNTYENYPMASSESIADAWATGLSLSTMISNIGSSSYPYRAGGCLCPAFDLSSIKIISDKRLITFKSRARTYETSAPTYLNLDLVVFSPFADDDWRLTCSSSYANGTGTGQQYCAVIPPHALTSISEGVELSCRKGRDQSSSADASKAEFMTCKVISGITEITGSGSGLYFDVEYTFDLNHPDMRWIWIDYSAEVPATHSGTFDEMLEGMKALYGTTELRLGLRVQNCSNGSVGNWSDRFVGPKSFSCQFDSMINEDVSSYIDIYNPYANGDLKISALPFRAYESIYNAFYRNQFNDPFTINGVKEFNKFITTDEGGEDDTDYDLLKRNYEQDFLTSAKQSPVDGDITPLVGVSGTGVFTFQNADGTQVNITPKYAEDGTTIIGLETVEGTPENTSSIRRMMDMASVGISINDFRNVNALQRWLETNLRRGYRYKDQLLSHFGVEAKFDVLDMPEFLGGMSEPVMVNQINQSVDQTGSPSGIGDFSKVLGSYAGQASVLAQSRHDVEKYCDEHGFIIGVLSITPVPNYSQLLPKFFLKNNVLDYYFPEFGHIGNQPIPYSEVCPLQSYIAGDPLTDVFGYQRAWYDYLASVDEVHGDFRTSLEGFLINRVFNSRPELGKDFLEVDADTMSNPFSVTDKTDKILGQVYFEVTAQRPIPKFGIPRLE